MKRAYTIVLFTFILLIIIGCSDNRYKFDNESLPSKAVNPEYQITAVWGATQEITGYTVVDNYNLDLTDLIFFSGNDIPEIGRGG